MARPKKSKSEAVSNQTSPVANAPTDTDKMKKLAAALSNIKKAHGDGALMRLGDVQRVDIEPISTQCISLDHALGIGGLPKGRVIEIYGPESAGKCQCKDHFISTPNGVFTVEEIFEENNVVLSSQVQVIPRRANLINRNCDIESTTHFTSNGVHPVKKITTRSGRELKTTYNHPHLVMSKTGYSWIWKNTQDIQEGDCLVCMREAPYFGDKEVSDKLAYFLGIMIADGTLDDTRISITNDEEKIKRLSVEMFESLSQKSPNIYPNSENGSENIRLCNKDWVTSFYEEWGLESCVAKDKKITKEIRRLNRNSLREFIKGYVDCECSIDAEKTALDVTSASKNLLVALKNVLLQFGIQSFLKEKVVKNYRENDYYRLTISGFDFWRYYEIIGTNLESRQAKFEEARSMGYTQVQTNHDSIPNVGLVLDDLYNENETNRETNRLMGDYKGENPKVNLTYERLQRILNSQKWENSRALDRLEELQRTNYYYDEVVSVDEHDAIPTFDFAMEHTHSFLAEGAVTHNTTLALHAVSQAQKDGGVVAFVDAEHALDVNYAKCLGVNTDELLISQPDCGEQALEIVDALVQSGSVDAVVIDSVAALVPRAELDGEMGQSHVGLQARLMSQALRKLAAVSAKTKTLVIFINQLREKVGVMFGSNETTPGGRALKFYSSVRIDIRRIGSIKDGEKVIGNRTKAKIVKNKVAPPFKEVEFDIMYGEGISYLGDLIDNAVSLGLVDKAGAWYSYNGARIGQGRANAIEHLKANEIITKEIDDKIRKRLFTKHSVSKTMIEVPEEEDYEEDVA